MEGFPLPTGSRVEFNGVEITRIADDRVAEIWLETDMLGLMQQLGAISTE